MSLVTRICREEWRALRRDKVAVFGLLLLTVLTLVAALNAHEHQRHVNAERARYQAQATALMPTPAIPCIWNRTGKTAPTLATCASRPCCCVSGS